MNEILSRQKMRQCIYCLGWLPASQITDDHIIAGSWYPDTTPPTVQRWTAPACNKCNNFYSPLERYVHVRLAACIDPTHPAVSGMWEKARNSIDPKRARNNRDWQHRTRQRDAFWKSLTELQQVPAHALPFSIENFMRGSRTALIMEAEKVDSLIQKWVRGLYYKLRHQSLSLNSEISVIHLPNGKAASACEAFWSHRKQLDTGPGIKIFYFTIDEGNRRGDIYIFRIWDRFEVFTSVNETISSDENT